MDMVDNSGKTKTDNIVLFPVVSSWSWHIVFEP